MHPWSNRAFEVGQKIRVGRVGRAAGLDLVLCRSILPISVFRKPKRAIVHIERDRNHVSGGERVHIGAVIRRLELMAVRMLYVARRPSGWAAGFLPADPEIQGVGTRWIVVDGEFEEPLTRSDIYRPENAAIRGRLRGGEIAIVGGRIGALVDRAEGAIIVGRRIRNHIIRRQPRRREFPEMS